MKYPCLIRKRDCKTPVYVKLEQEGVDKYGEPLKPVEGDFMCNYQDTAKTILTAEKKQVQLSGIALFAGDIAPELPVISGGIIKVNGIERSIAQGTKARNPDGTVNYCRLDVM